VEAGVAAAVAAKEVVWEEKEAEAGKQSPADAAGAAEAAVEKEVTAMAAEDLERVAQVAVAAGREGVVMGAEVSSEMAGAAVEKGPAGQKAVALEEGWVAWGSEGLMVDGEARESEAVVQESTATEVLEAKNQCAHQPGI